MSLLTPEEIVRLTGRRKKSLQIKWLTEHQIPHYVNAAGYPQVFSHLLPTSHLSEFELGEVR